jgi:ATP-dependent DNA helicase RecQ
VSAAKEVAGGKVGAVHGPAVEARFERLRTLRLELARERGWKAFQVLHDSTLVEIARVRPRSIDELMGIPGIGKRKAEEFGKELLAELTKG